MEASSNPTPEETPAKVDPLNNDNVNQAAYSFKKSSDLARSRTSSPAISKKGMARVLNAVIEFPIGEKDPKFFNKFEHELFVLTLQCLQAKTVMMNAILTSRQETSDKLIEAENAIKEGEANV